MSQDPTPAAGGRAADADLFARFAGEALAAGRPDVAGECLRRAAAPVPPSRPGDADRAHAAGLQFLSQEKFREAEAALAHAVRLAPDRTDWHDHLGVAIARQQRFAEAEATFRLSLRLAPAQPEAVRHLTQCLLDQRKWADAESVARTALRLEPAAEDLRLQLATALGEQGKVDDAAAELNAVLAANPTSADAWNRLGLLYGHAGRYEEAAAAFRKVTEVVPDFAPAHGNLAAALGKRNRWADAAEAAREAVRLDPNHGPGWGNLGNALRDLGELPDAAQALERATQLNPNFAEAYGNLALTLVMQGRVREALPLYDRAVQLNPNAADVRFNRAVAWLSLGDYDRGWPEYEWRWRTEQMRHLPRSHPAPPWDGSDPAGKTILVHTEQGIGDALQFVRFAADLAARGARVVLQATSELAALLGTCPGVSLVARPGDLPPACDFHCPLMSLPLRLGTRVDAIPNRVPYLTAPADAAAKWRDRLAGVRGFKVGVAWQGNPKHIGDRWRSVPLSRFAPLAAVPGVTLVSVQKGPGAEQVAGCGFPLLDLGPELGDFGDTAGLLTNLDLIASVDTAVVHLAGALARPVWVALPLNADWRWLRDREDSPWYPTARLFRQSKFGEWGPVFARMADELRSRRGEPGA